MSFHLVSALGYGYVLRSAAGPCQLLPWSFVLTLVRSCCVIQDTYLAEGDSKANFLVYICAALLLNWSDELKQLEFQELILFLQHLPTDGWDYSEVSVCKFIGNIQRDSCLLHFYPHPSSN